MENLNKLFNFINLSPTPYHAVQTMSEMLDAKGFKKLSENEEWKLSEGDYYVTRDQSSLIGLKIGPKSDFRGYRIVASHSDTPGFKIKPNGELSSPVYKKLSSEVYGGPIYSTWLDRKLGIAGRVMVLDDGTIKTKLVNVPNCAIIPNVAIHYNRDVNNGIALNPQIDLATIIGQADDDKKPIIEALLGVNNIYAHDLFFYNDEAGSVFGTNDYFVSPRIDNLECAYTTLKGFLEAQASDDVLVYACFNNEEIGSATKQGAGSTFLKDVLTRVSESFNQSKEKHLIALANSFMVSADNAHAIHPNRPEKTDPVNYAKMNEGIVIKYSARQSYTSDAFSVALFQKACDLANVPYQAFTNRSDERGGGTLGAISSSQVSITSLDIGLAQLAMHSSLEVAGVKDPTYMIKAIKSFMELKYQKKNDEWIIE